jgi:hypothetical protein
MKVSKASVLPILFLKHVNMLQLMKRFAKTIDLFLSSIVWLDLHKCITWPKQWKKGKQEWN